MKTTYNLWIQTSTSLHLYFVFESLWAAEYRLKELQKIGKKCFIETSDQTMR